MPNRKLSFSWAWQSTPERELQVTIDLKPDNDGTMLTLTHEQFFSETARDDHGRGWGMALDRLEALYPMNLDFYRTPIGLSDAGSQAALLDGLPRGPGGWRASCRAC